jgi:hypothetical protein
MWQLYPRQALASHSSPIKRAEQQTQALQISKAFTPPTTSGSAASAQTPACACSASSPKTPTGSPQGWPFTFPTPYSPPIAHACTRGSSPNAAFSPGHHMLPHVKSPFAFDTPVTTELPQSSEPTALSTHNPTTAAASPFSAEQCKHRLSIPPATITTKGTLSPHRGGLAPYFPAVRGDCSGEPCGHKVIPCACCLQASSWPDNAPACDECVRGCRGGESDRRGALVHDVRQVRELLEEMRVEDGI